MATGMYFSVNAEGLLRTSILDARQINIFDGTKKKN
jgi:hypothetical protein